MFPTAKYWILSTTVLLFTVAITSQKLSKAARCHMLRNSGCNVSLYKILDYEEAGWFYHAPFRSCRPFYSPKGKVCRKNRDLPLTKAECEHACGERCKLPNGNSGICMMEGSCDIEMPASYNPRPCQAYNVQCCPKGSNDDKNII